MNGKDIIHPGACLYEATGLKWNSRNLIRLTEPVQVRILDALAEAAGVPHQRGQSEFIIPDEILTYNKRTAEELRKQQGR
jgi:hypothetical protein